MTQLELIFLISLLTAVPIASGVASFLFWRMRFEMRRQSEFESKFKDMLAERNRHLAKLVESLLFESLALVREDISDSDYQEGRIQATRVVEETNKAIRLLEERSDSSSIANMTILQVKLQDMVDNLDSEIVARQEQDQSDIDYKTLN